MSNVYTISAGRPFADALAAGLMARVDYDPLRLAEMTLLLPNRRAIRTVSEAFLRQSEGRVALLPRLSVLGETEEDSDIAFSGTAALSLPPEIPVLKRRVLLARLIMARGFGPENRPPTADQALKLAEELGRFLDEVQAEGCDFKQLTELVPQELAHHWELTVEFLKILTEVWPTLLQAEDAMDRIMRRDALIEEEIKRWRAAPPDHPVIVAGTSAPSPAARNLVAAVLDLPGGEAVLPGLSPDLDTDHWRAVTADACHPQHLLKLLLDHLGQSPDTVVEWPWDANGEADYRTRTRRVAALSEVARPPATTEKWRDAPPLTSLALDGIERIDCPTDREEAVIAALKLREALDTPERTAMLVTPDRNLARRTAAELKRFGIEIDDSAGVPLSETPPARYLRLLADVLAQDMAPVPLLSLLKHPMAAGGRAPGEFRKAVRLLEVELLHGPRPAAGLTGLQMAYEARRAQEIPKLSNHAEWEIAKLLGEVSKILGTAEAIFGGPPQSPADLLATLIKTAEDLAASEDSSGPERLWVGEDGETLSETLHEALGALGDLGPIEPLQLPGILDAALGGRNVRPRYGGHPRLQILGPLEAQLARADLVVLGGVIEGQWPAATGDDPWMSRPMRARFRLPPLERRVGQSAHDFFQLLAAPEVVVTRAERSGGTPTVPSRWLTRLDALLAKGGEETKRLLLPNRPWLAAAEHLDRPVYFEARRRPRPVPDVAARPTILSVTQVETWMRDPYALYAQKVLRLKRLDPLDADPDAAGYGNLIHESLDRFLQETVDGLGADPVRRLLEIGAEEFKPLQSRPGVVAFWWPRFERIADWFVIEETARRTRVAKTVTETDGKIEVAEGVTIRARADRIDLMHDGTAAILDYKTGVPPSWTDVALGYAPQLPLEALILAAGAFERVRAAEVSELSFWRLSGGRPAGEIKLPGGRAVSAEEMIEAARIGIAELIRCFADPKTPYLPIPRPDKAPKYTDYAHLARIKEWYGYETKPGGSS